MSAIVLILPIISRCAFHDDAWLEQYDRERLAAMMNELHPPARTRPILVIDRRSGGSAPAAGLGLAEGAPDGAGCGGH
jgi:hypothetical protein